MRFILFFFVLITSKSYSAQIEPNLSNQLLDKSYLFSQAINDGSYIETFRIIKSGVQINKKLNKRKDNRTIICAIKNIENSLFPFKIFI